MAKHAPGPWVNSNGQIVDNFGEAVLLNGFSLSSGYDSNRSQTEANTRLAVAAPEMLEALEEINECFESATLISRATINKVRAAIAKAKGDDNG